jgi:hypothetical protein
MNVVELNEKAGGERHFSEALQTKCILAKETHVRIIWFSLLSVIDKEMIGWASPSIRDMLNME